MSILCFYGFVVVWHMCVHCVSVRIDTTSSKSGMWVCGMWYVLFSIWIQVEDRKFSTSHHQIPSRELRYVICMIVVMYTINTYVIIQIRYVAISHTPRSRFQIGNMRSTNLKPQICVLSNMHFAMHNTELQMHRRLEHFASSTNGT